MSHISTLGAGRRARRIIVAALAAASASAGLAAAGASPAHAMSQCRNLDLRNVPPWCFHIPGPTTTRMSPQLRSALPARTHIVFRRMH